MCSLVVICGALAAGKPQPVRNVIYMIGDGMGLAHVSMLMIENGYAPTAFDRAHNVALISTYSANNRVTDSAAAGTALATGHKTGNAMLGVDLNGKPLESIIARAEKEGMPTGLAVCCYLQHATPGAFYAHVGDRGDTEHINPALLESGIDVLLGGGRKRFMQTSSEGGTYFDAFRRRNYNIVGSLAEADTIHSGQLLGVFADKHLPNAPERGDYLVQATNKALEILSNNAAKQKKGFVLMVEGSIIDYAGHGNDAKWLLAEMRDFEKAVAAAMDYADRTPGTLVVVTADHETGGLTIPSGDSDFTQAESGVEYKFGTSSHTGTLVPVYFYGASASEIRGVMDNTELSNRIAELLKLK